MSRLDAWGRRAWDLLPEGALNSDAARRLRHAKHQARAGRAAAVRLVTGRTLPTQRVVTSLAELDEMLRRVDDAAAVSDEEMRRAFRSFRVELRPELPEDPFSPEYRAAVMDLYEWLHGAPYGVANEYTAIDPEYHTARPFPFSTGSATIAGDHLMAVGHVVRTMQLAPGSRVLELGAGWGNVTVALAQLGHRVTAVDVSPQFVDLLRARAEMTATHIEAVTGDFSVVHELAETYDAVLFFESFHHCADHLDLLAGLDGIVAPGGAVYFAGEPVMKEMPVPWGLRLDGESLWAIRTNGWMELGFRRSYFLAALARSGWAASVSQARPIPSGTVYIARRG